MNPGGLVIIIAGVVIACQVFGGNALERMNVVSPSTSSSGSAKPSVALGGGSTAVLPA